MLAAMARVPHRLPAAHLPAQSGSDRLLKLMKRQLHRREALSKISDARRAIPGVVLSTDIIVGFPTETDEDFEKTLALSRKMKPASAYCFKYSRRARGRNRGETAGRRPAGLKEERLVAPHAVVDRLTTTR